MRFVLLMLLDLLPLLSAAAPRQEAVPLRPGMVISSSVKIARRGYLLPSGDETGKSGAVIVRGSDLTVDFNGAELRGTSSNTAPNERKGTGLLIEGRNITLKNLRVQGYKIGLFARHCVNLRLLGGDASFNWKQRLGSTREREDESDWQSYHHNENDEWLRYGAALYLRDCDRFEVKGVTVQGGQCGLMLVNSSHGKVWNCDFSFLSGVGLGLYRACDNQVLHNRIDFCVRGFSYGVYNRGQDSAGILVYEQSSRNTFAYNSATHGGDGFFLWAGQSTMDTGQGGCSDNLVYGNDFSYAPANGIEATFSRNRFVNNRAAECDYGLWGGYSFDTLIQANQFYNNRIGIAIEHGQHNKIEGNVITGGDELISLWQNASQDPNWSYPKHHDTVSHDYVIRGNTLALPARVALRLRSTREVRFTDNTSLLRQGQNLLETANVDGLLSEHNGAVRLRRNRAADSAGDDLKDLAAAPFDPLPRRGALPTPPLAGIDAPRPFREASTPLWDGSSGGDSGTSTWTSGGRTTSASLAWSPDPGTQRLPTIRLSLTCLGRRGNGASNPLRAWPSRRLQAQCPAHSALCPFPAKAPTFGSTWSMSGRRCATIGGSSRRKARRFRSDSTRLSRPSCGMSASLSRHLKPTRGTTPTLFER